MMMSEVFFREVQKFRQWWLMVILILVLAIWLWSIIQQLVLGIPFGNAHVSDLGLVLIGIIAIIPVVLIFWIKLITEFRNDGIHYKMYPITGNKKIMASDIKRWYIREYKPLCEFGGWGLRFGLQKGKGHAVNMSGRNGLQLELQNGKKLLIGTRHPNKVKEAMEKIFKS